MYNVVMTIPGAQGITSGYVEAVYERVFASLVSCLPSLLHAKLEPMHSGSGTDLLGCCSLWFPSEQDLQFALCSREWVELIDETADVFDWDALEFSPMNAEAARGDLVLS